MEAIEKNNASNTHQEKAKKLRKLRRWQIAVSLLGAAIVVWGIVEVACLFLGYNRTETSNDAQIEQYISPINLRASGYIKKIYFTEHQEVHKGDTLLVLDDREYKIRVMEAEAALKDALAGATVIGATLQTTQTTASVYDASISEIEIRLAKLEKDRQRYQNLVQRNAATPIQLEQIETEYEATRKKLEATKRQQKAALSGVNEVSHRRSRHPTGNRCFGNGTSESFLHRSSGSLRWQIGTPGTGRRPVHHSRTNHYLYPARYSKMDCRQL